MAGEPKCKVLVIYPAGQGYYSLHEAFGLCSSSAVTLITDGLDYPSRLRARTHVRVRRYRLDVPKLGTTRIAVVSVPDLSRTISYIKPDVVVTFELFSSISFQVAMTRDAFRFRHLVLCDETVPERSSLWGRFPLTRVYALKVRLNADYFITHTERAREMLVRSGVNIERISRIYPGIDLGDVPVETSGVRSTDDILYVGKLRRNKGICFLLDAMIRVIDETGRSARLVIAGSGPLLGWLKSLRTRLPWLRVLGPVSEAEKWDLMSRSTIFAYPSQDIQTLGLKRWEEQVGISVIEAMAAGLPVVATDSGALPEILGRDDVIVPQRQSTLLAERISELLSNAALRKSVSDFNAARARDLFDIRKYAKRLEEEFFRLKFDETVSGADGIP